MYFPKSSLLESGAENAAAEDTRRNRAENTGVRLFFIGIVSFDLTGEYLDAEVVKASDETVALVEIWAGRAGLAVLLTIRVATGLGRMLCCRAYKYS